MSTTTKHRGRPTGPKRAALSAWVSGNGQFTMGQLARGLNWSVRDANDVIRRALDRQELTRLGSMAQPGCKRPVAVYARTDDRPAPTLDHVLKAWIR